MTEERWENAEDNPRYRRLDPVTRVAISEYERAEGRLRVPEGARTTDFLRALEERRTEATMAIRDLQRELQNNWRNEWFVPTAAMAHTRIVGPAARWTERDLVELQGFADRFRQQEGVVWWDGPRPPQPTPRGVAGITGTWLDEIPVPPRPPRDLVRSAWDDRE